MQSAKDHSMTFIGVCEETSDVGTHVLQYFWTCVFTKFSYPLAYFVTRTASYTHLIKYFWEGVRLLMAANLTVVMTIFDGSPANRRFQVLFKVDMLSYSDCTPLHNSLST